MKRKIKTVMNSVATLTVATLLVRSADAATIGEWLFDAPPIGPTFLVTNEVAGGVMPQLINWNPTTYSTDFQAAGGPFFNTGPYHSVGMLQMDNNKSAYAASSGIDCVGKQLTIEMWINPIAAGSLEYPISINGQVLRLDSVVGGYQLTGFISDTSGGTFVYPTLAAIPTGVWSHIAMTYDGASLKTYLNGVLDGSVAVATTLTNGTTVLDIGSGNFGAVPFGGSIDEVRISDVALLPGDGSGMGVLAWNATLVPEPSMMALVSASALLFLRRKAQSR